MNRYLITSFALIIILTINSCSKEKDPSSSCPTNYTGTNCDQQITPSSITITEVKVLEFPCVDPNGDPWDLLDDPDLKVTISNGNQVLFQSSYIDNCSCLSTYSFPCSASANAVDQFSFTLKDDDSPLSDNFIGGINAYLYSSTGGFPTSKILDAGGGIRYEIKLSYAW